MNAPRTKSRKPTAQLLSSARIVDAPAIPTEIELEETPVEIQPPKRRFSFGKVFWACLVGLAGLAFGIWIDTLIEDLFARTPWLGYVGLALTGLLIFAFIVVFVKEIRALSRLQTLRQLKRQATKAYKRDDLNLARAAVRNLLNLYSTKPETARGRSLLQSQLGEVMDGRDLFLLAERDLLAELDAKANSFILSSSKRTSIVTAISPRALIDVLYVVVENVRLIRRISELYGGRPGLFSSWRLAGTVVSHLALTGGISAGDNLIQDALGHGLAAKVSARLGEGVINGMLTARVGRAAMTVCRPLPFLASKPPSLKSIFGELTKTKDNQHDVPR
ncbi:TIGR01620 family protein [uncultured Maritalea sp.]|uniref:YcjF family protein n=1 Tax=uncultured Maritalea sp. TaxID=757249 RepID=UPI002603C86F|nr:TIGR01620 family protein [uncultured Maritalea sp.]